MAYLISKPTSRELRENLRASARGDSRIRGRVRTLEEADQISRRMEREGEAFTKPYEVSGNSPEAKQAHYDMQLRQGLNPETGERL